MSPGIRRLSLACVAIAVSALLLHSQISSALVLRGDDLNAGGRTEHALEMYRRAIAWDGGSEIAVDRVAFAEAISHRRPLEEDAIALATRYLRRAPKSTMLLMDRALAQQILRRYPEAEADFLRAERITPSARTLTFAGFAALHAGNRLTARALFVAAERLDKKFIPARHGLAQV